MRYRSKIDWWFYLIVAFFTFEVIRLWMFYFEYHNAVFIITGILLACINFLFIIPLMFDTSYTFEDGSLRIKCWICTNMRIKYSDIISIRETKNPLSSAALSIDRIEIRFFSGESTNCILISPVKKKEFLEKLRRYFSQK